MTSLLSEPAGACCHDSVQEMPDKEYCSPGAVIRAWPTRTELSVGASGSNPAGRPYPGRRRRLD